MEKKAWYAIANEDEIVSPSLLVYPDRIVQNIETMLEMVGDPNRLRPHIKTHKTAEIIQMQMDHGIHKFKCATIAEAELLGKCGAKDVLLAMQPVGVNISRFLDLVSAYPDTAFSTIVDNQNSIQELSSLATSRKQIVSLFLDLNTGMNRTGIAPGDEALRLYRAIDDDPFMEVRGLHAYDGHIRSEDISERTEICNAAFEQVLELKVAIEAEGLSVSTLVAGGSPTFPIHAKRKEVEASPGTTLLWDERYGTSFREMQFIPAAVLFTRIVSRPQPDLICLDIGHKAIAPEMDFPRVRIFGMEQYEQIGQSEEHLVVRCSENHTHEVGDAFYAIPMHICPTVAKYPKVQTVIDGHTQGSWKVAARDHQMTI